MVLLGTVFSLTFLCAIVPCDITLDPPEVSIQRKFYKGEHHLRNEYPVVVTGSGKIRGYSMATLLGNRVHAFEGIRYALPPTGNLRFQPPVASGPWPGIFSAFKPGPRCIQFHPSQAFTVLGNEDCLFLNIYSPNVPETNEVEAEYKTRSIPVVVWFHGGSFIFGAGHEYGPAYICDQNLILITVNYRVGVYGFMSTGDEASPGNYGLKDQVLALKWIHENIHVFGGNPQNVTLMGQSAGGVSAHLHMISNQSRTYFSSAVSLSSSGFLNWAVQTPCQAKFWTNWLADLVKCPRTTSTGGSHALVDCFKRHNPNFLVAYSVRLLKWFLFPPVLFAPVVEIDHPGAFLKDTPANHYRRGDVAKKPWISGNTAEECYLMIYFLEFFQQMKYLRRHFTANQAIVFDYDHLLNATAQNEVNQKIQKFYFGSQSPETVSTTKIAQAFSDRYFTNGQLTAIKSHAQVAATYAYYFDFVGRANLGKVLGRLPSEWRAVHGEDSYYFFNSSTYHDGMIKTSQDFRLSQIMLNLLGNFARTGVPSYTEPNGTNRIIWEVQKPSRPIRFLKLAKQVQMIHNPFTTRTEFWETLGIPDVTPFSISDQELQKLC